MPLVDLITKVPLKRLKTGMKEAGERMKSGWWVWGIILLCYMHRPSSQKMCWGCGDSAVTEPETSGMNPGPRRWACGAKGNPTVQPVEPTCWPKGGLSPAPIPRRMVTGRGKGLIDCQPAVPAAPAQPGNAHRCLQLCFHRELPTVFLLRTAIMHYRKIQISGKARIHSQNTL